jgi:hypothetical protein
MIDPNPIVADDDLLNTTQYIHPEFDGYTCRVRIKSVPNKFGEIARIGSRVRATFSR